MFILFYSSISTFSLLLQIIFFLYQSDVKELQESCIDLLYWCREVHGRVLFHFCPILQWSASTDEIYPDVFPTLWPFHHIGKKTRQLKNCTHFMRNDARGFCKWRFSLGCSYLILHKSSFKNRRHVCRFCKQVHVYFLTLVFPSTCFFPTV